ncbi:hypothetical protein CWB89_11465 [Pseudoalteromonas piscicida]|uniref:Uncharacterized protein n=1 Tax=Pseudoalteromonas piscicida TaxID=43662 RepID=A0AAQ2ERT1_PSEO7|nr:MULTISPECIES: hypothetical protein [Pseudoalteromonas]KJY89293.1 hypothetical protein TW75_10300 [Pseudoalteromonas piscicida]MDP4489331.1 hypothetical protein [Pseudoalteromonas piscicida]TMN36955.1 hypothetical protein CWB95_16395 [Pseudoalteromonas piscicida]TMN42333.1 hypothetical protein CWB94_05495 [Pseudoalteromonas piscicida]TMN53091.1 hypothetical protein CWB92_09115 [Pseudoalteromonas piscicida]
MKLKIKKTSLKSLSSQSLQLNLAQTPNIAGGKQEYNNRPQAVGTRVDCVSVAVHLPCVIM